MRESSAFASFLCAIKNKILSLLNSILSFFMLTFTGDFSFYKSKSCSWWTIQNRSASRTSGKKLRTMSCACVYKCMYMYTHIQ